MSNAVRIMSGDPFLSRVMTIFIDMTILDIYTYIYIYIYIDTYIHIYNGTGAEETRAGTPDIARVRCRDQSAARIDTRSRQCTSAEAWWAAARRWHARACAHAAQAGFRLTADHPPPACPAPASSSPAGLSAHCSCAPAPAGPRYRCAVGPSAQLHAVAIWFAPPGLVRAQRKPRRPRPCRRSWRVDQSDLGRSRRRRQRGVDEEARHAHAQSQSAHAAGQVRG